MTTQDKTEEEVKRILRRYKTVAVVGLSRDPKKDSHAVASYLQSKGYEIIPINPFCNEVLGKKCHRSLLETPEEIIKTLEIVDIFRPSPDIPPIVEQAIQLRKKYGKPEVIWTQLGIFNEEAAKSARDSGMTVIMNRCTKIEHSKMERR